MALRMEQQNKIKVTISMLKGQYVNMWLSVCVLSVA